MSMRSHRVWGLATLLCLASACNSEEKAATSTPKIEPLSEAEVARGKKACASYAERVCACAETQPELKEACTLAKPRLDAFQIQLDLLGSEGLKLGEQKAVKVEARKIAAACFQADSKLDVAICPRKTP